MKNKISSCFIFAFLISNLYTSNYKIEQKINISKNGYLMAFDDESKMIGTIELFCKDAIEDKVYFLLYCPIFREKNDSLTAGFLIVPYFECMNIEFIKEETILFLLEKNEVLSKMLQQAENECKKLFVKKIHIYVQNQKNILSFYRQQGFFESYVNKLYRLSCLRKLYWLLTDEWMLTDPNSIKLEKNI